MAHRALPLNAAARLAALRAAGPRLLACLWLAAAPLAAAQPSTPAPAASLAAHETFAAALRSGQDPHPDQPAWRAAYEAAAVAVAEARAAGDAAHLRDALRHAAHVYAHIGWHSRAFEAYDEFLAEGGELTTAPVLAPTGAELPSDLAAFVASANQLAFARYEVGDTEGAMAYYLTVLDFHPDEPEALRWLGRIAFEQGDEPGAQVAANYFGRLVELDPDDDAARYFLELSRERMAIGVAASDAYRAGIALYEAGDPAAALERFEAAAAAAPGFTEAFVWAGRTALEQGRPQAAIGHWRRVVAARPDDAGAAWFLGLAETQARWGVAAGRAYYEGLAAYEEGDLKAAAERFVAAAEANQRFTDAWVWAARSLQEDGQALASIPYWERVLELDPADERARWYVTRARTALEHGEVAGPAYYDALARYQAGDAATALALLETALEADPQFVQAWGLLGRITFQQQRYAEAAEAYQRAAELEPDNDDYAFFAQEARSLSEAEEGSDDR